MLIRHYSHSVTISKRREGYVHEKLRHGVRWFSILNNRSLWGVNCNGALRIESSLTLGMELYELMCGSSCVNGGGLPYVI
jgi:hypothetical protein